jgi:CelD/BcsL family acetyltransferase involved in cellulose biosynthesis
VNSDGATENERARRVGARRRALGDGTCEGVLHYLTDAGTAVRVSAGLLRVLADVDAVGYARRATERVTVDGSTPAGRGRALPANVQPPDRCEVCFDLVSPGRVRRGLFRYCSERCRKRARDYKQR